MVLGALSSLGTLQLDFATACMDSAEYIQVLKNRLLLYLRHFHHIPLIYQNNAAIHRSNATTVWFNQHHIKLLEWPAQSPDIILMENVWAIPVRRIYTNNKQYDSVEELKIGILAAWQNLEPNVLQKLADVTKTRPYDLIMSKGGPISY
jgi:hypothetical protein